MTEVKAITAVHQRELSGYERTIERGIGTFVEVGNALKAIRDKKLYMLTHKNFTEYVEDRWKWKKRYAYYLIDSSASAEVVHNCAQDQPILTNESQAREVAKAPLEKQAEVVEVAQAKAAEENRKPKASDFKEARETVCAEPAAELEYEDADDADDEPAYDAKFIKSFATVQNRLATLRQLLTLLTEPEIEILKEWVTQ